MAEKRVFKLVHAQARRLAVETVQTAPDGYCVTVSEPTELVKRRKAEGLKRWECWATPEQIKLLKDDLLFYRLHGGKVKGSSVQARHK